MDNILVLQWPASSMADYDLLLRMERALQDALEPNMVVDGHDYGSGEMNIFVFSESPEEAFKTASIVLRSVPRWTEVKAAWRPAEGDAYTILWPPGLDTFSVK